MVQVLGSLGLKACAFKRLGPGFWSFWCQS